MANELSNNPFVGELCSYLVGPENIDSDTKQFKFVMTKDGVKKVVKNRIGTFVVDATEVPGLSELKTGVKLNVPKIPYNLYESMIQFFKRVMTEKGGAEAMLQFFYDVNKREYIAYCPKQTVSAGGIKFERDEEMEKKYILVADVHSHNSMSAFFSSIDNADEKRTMIFGVVGKLNRPTYEQKFRMSLSGEYQDLSVYDIFDMPVSTASFPEQWLENCEQAKSVTKVTSYGNAAREHYIWDDASKKFIPISQSESRAITGADSIRHINPYRDSTPFRSSGKVHTLYENKIIDFDGEEDDEEDDVDVTELPGGFDVTALDPSDLDFIIRDILRYRMDDLAEAIVDEFAYDDLTSCVINKMSEGC